MNEIKTLGDYTLIKRIGHGSMGPVYLAEHRFMKRQYILKVLPEELSSDRSFIQRFEEDVALLTALEHPNIVKIHTVSFAQGQYFLVTDCVVDEFGETTNLSQYLQARGNKWDEETLFRILKQLSEALDYAHSKKVNNKGIVHRNFKLNNILVAKGQGGIDLMISDFGLTRIIGPSATLTRCYKAVAESLGVAGTLFGLKTNVEKYSNPPIDAHKLAPLHASFLQSFPFLAPEQKRAEMASTVDYKADVYAFGVLAYYLLVADFPEGVFDLPSQITSDYAWNWDKLIATCLQQNPVKRPDSLVAALNEVRVIAKGQPKCTIFEYKSPEKQQEAIAVQDLSETLGELSLADVSLHLDSKISKAPQELIKANVSSENCGVTGDAIENILASDEIIAAGVAVSNALSGQKVLPSVLRPFLRSAEIERPKVDLDPASALLVDAAVKQYTPERREVKNIQPLLTDMVVIPGGPFYRGSMDGNRDEMPRHRITIHSLAIDIHAVTNEQFVRFLEVMGGEKDSNHQDIIRMRDSRIKRSGGKLSIESGYAKHPVVGVTWYGAIAYAKWIGKRLPTEAEWEIAALGGVDNLLYPTGDDIEKTQANFFSSDTTAVMSYAPNGYGLYDMGGNVYEWCHDWYGYNYYEISVQEPDDPTGPLQGVYRVLRGGCWKSLKEDLRCSRRHRNNPGTVNGTYGFRCAADVQ